MGSHLYFKRLISNHILPITVYQVAKIIDVSQQLPAQQVLCACATHVLGASEPWMTTIHVVPTRSCYPLRELLSYYLQLLR
jgi:hypothetical protein